MRVALKKLKNQVIVITGGSSGIGRATALSAARKGAKVVVASRNEEALRGLCDEIRTRGGEAIYCVADVSVASDLEKVAQTAIDRFGVFDTWINDAGVSIYGKLDETPLAEKRRVMDVNFWGVVHGCRAALPHLKEHGGCLINIGSVLSERAIPLQGVYCASKHAVKAYTDSLRMELEMERAPVSVTLIKPAAIDTPYTLHARNRFANEPVHTPPVYAPEVVARAVLICAQKPVRDVLVGGSGKLFSLMEKFIPGLTDRGMLKTMDEKHQSLDHAKLSYDSLFEASTNDELYGNYPGHVMRSSAYTEIVLHPVVSTLVAGALTAAAFMFFRRAGDTPVLDDGVVVPFRKFARARMRRNRTRDRARRVA